jgi:hypothetical protein
MTCIFFSSHKSAFIFIANLALADALLVVAEFVIVKLENLPPIQSQQLPDSLRKEYDL